MSERFARRAANPADAHRPIEPQQELASSLAKVECRKVGNDYTVAWNGRKWQIPKSLGPGLRGSAIRRKRFVPPPGQSRWKERFRVQGSTSWKAYREEAATVSPPLRSLRRAETGTFYFAENRNFLFFVDTFAAKPCNLIGIPVRLCQRSMELRLPGHTVRHAG